MRRLFPALILLSALCAARGEEPEGPGRCPYPSELLEVEQIHALRPAPSLDDLPGIRFSHISTLSPSEIEAPPPSPHQESREPISAFRPWELAQMAILIACAVVAVWLAYRKRED